MKVAHFIWSLERQHGGPQAVLCGLARALQEDDTHVTIVATQRANADESLADEMRACGVAVRLVGPTRGPLGRHPRLKSEVARAVQDADIVHVHGVWEEIAHLAPRLARQTNTPCVICPHGMLDPWSLRQGRLKKRLYMAWRARRNLQNASALHCTTTIERDLLAPLRLRPPVFIEPNGLSWQEFEGIVKGEFRARVEAQNRPLLVFLSRVHHKKGLELLIPALARMTHRDALLCVCGPGEPAYVERLKALAKTHNVQDRVLFTGAIYGRARLEVLGDADVFVLPSHQENFGIVVIEALAVGTPVVISDQVNVFPEVQAARLGGVAPLQIEALARELDCWLENDQLRADASRRAPAWTRERYDWQLLAQRWNDHYARLLVRALSSIVTPNAATADATSLSAQNS